MPFIVPAHALIAAETLAGILNAISMVLKIFSPRIEKCYNNHMTHKAVFFNLEAWAEDYLKNNPALAGAGIEVGFADQVLDKNHLAPDANFDILGTFVDSTADAGVIAALPNLKHIATLSTGFDHIDLAACAARGITVSRVPAYGENTVAEYAFGLMLSLSRKICEAKERVKNEGSFRLDGLRGFDLMGRTLGVLGTGHIGQNSIRIAKGFGMNVIAFDAFPNPALAAQLGFTYRPLEDVLRESDIVTIHVPYLPSTHHLINAQNIGLMKPDAYLINTARGAVVETGALVAALKNGKLGGAGLDVLEEEGIIKDELNYLVTDETQGHDLRVVLEDHALIDMPNVIITPHNAFNTKEAFTRILDTTIGNIVAFVNGAPDNLVALPPSPSASS
jgi:D-lactate dehydrogenase